MSRHLPADHDPALPLALIAGKGQYPVLLAQRAREAGIPLRLIAFEGETDERLHESFPGLDRIRIKVGQLGKMLKALKKFEAGYAVMAGQITPGKLFKGLHPDLKAVALLASLKEKNAETIFGAIAEEITAAGTTLLDARIFMDDDLATEGTLCGKFPARQRPWLDHGIRIATQVAALDIGQGIVVRKGTVLAVEAFEGTDAMLERAGQFKTKDAIFVKTVKPRQDYRFDVPVFGARTLEKLASADIRTAALAAQSTILLDKEHLLNDAADRGITLLGFPLGM